VTNYALRRASFKKVTSSRLQKDLDVCLDDLLCLTDADVLRIRTNFPQAKTYAQSEADITSAVAALEGKRGVGANRLPKRMLRWLHRGLRKLSSRYGAV